VLGRSVRSVRGTLGSLVYRAANVKDCANLVDEKNDGDHSLSKHDHKFAKDNNTKWPATNL
jgi:hypothetical protein